MNDMHIQILCFLSEGSQSLRDIFVQTVWKEYEPHERTKANIEHHLRELVSYKYAREVTGTFFITKIGTLALHQACTWSSDEGFTRVKDVPLLKVI